MEILVISIVVLTVVIATLGYWGLMALVAIAKILDRIWELYNFDLKRR